MSVARDFLGVLGYRVLLALLILLTDVIIARTFGPEWKGYFAILLVSPLIIATIAGLGLDYGLNYLGHKDPSQLSGYFTTALILGLSSSGIFALILGLDIFGVQSAVFASIPLSARQAILPAVLAVPGELFFMLAAFFAITSGKVLIYGRMRVLRRFVVFLSVILAATLWAATFPLNLTFVVGLHFLGMVLAACYAVRACGIPLSPPCPNFGFVLSSGLSAYLGRLAERLLLRLDVLLLGMLGSAHAVGLYSVAVGIAESILFVSTTLQAVLFSVRAEQREESHFSAFRAMVIGGAALVIACGLAAWWLIPLVFGKAFEGSVQLCLLLLPGIYLFSLGHTLQPYLVQKRKAAWITRAQVIALVVNAGLNIWLIPKYGAVAASIASSFCYSCSFVALLASLHSLHPGRLHTLLLPTAQDLVKLRMRAIRSTS